MGKICICALLTAALTAVVCAQGNTVDQLMTVAKVTPGDDGPNGPQSWQVEVHNLSTKPFAAFGVIGVVTYADGTNQKAGATVDLAYPLALIDSGFKYSDLDTVTFLPSHKYIITVICPPSPSGARSVSLSVTPRLVVIDEDNVAFGDAGEIGLLQISRKRQARQHQEVAAALARVQASKKPIAEALTAESLAVDSLNLETTDAFERTTLRKRVKEYLDRLQRMVPTGVGVRSGEHATDAVVKARESQSQLLINQARSDSAVAARYLSSHGVLEIRN